MLSSAYEFQSSQLRICITYNGRLIPLHYRSLLTRIFNEGAQIDGDDSELRKEGLGTGITICKKIVQQYGGSIGINFDPHTHEATITFSM